VTAACPNATGSYRFCKPTGRCIYSPHICNRIQDCPDDSDEINCSEYTLQHSPVCFLHMSMKELKATRYDTKEEINVD